MVIFLPPVIVRGNAGINLLPHLARDCFNSCP
jgi:hypothetical protein